MPAKAKCLNPVFTSWLEEMRDEIDPDAKYWNVYNRAVKAMSTHDRCLEHPKDCAEVKFIGPKIRDKLIQRHNELQGIESNSPQKNKEPSGSRSKPGALPSKSSKVALRRDTVESSSNESQETPPSKSTRANGNAFDRPTARPAMAKKSVKGSGMAPSTSLSGPGSDAESTASKSPTKPVRTKLPPQTLTLPPTLATQRRAKYAPVRPRPRISQSMPAPSATSDIEPDDDRVDETALSSFEPLVFPPESYTIKLILDEREVKSTKDRDYMLNGLRERGITAEKRALEIGDVCWIACSNNRVDEQETECVLDYIVERKRMDDLKSSILDGRFHEQKFRLKHTGISHVYYLVEDYDTERILGQWREQINTALSSTQVIDRFYLKQTGSIKDTLDYLARLHNTIQTIYKARPSTFMQLIIDCLKQGKALYIIPPRVIKRHKFLALKRKLSTMDNARIYHTTYGSYQTLNRKNGFFTLQDNMARILQCIRGLSEEKISTLIERYPTPRSLYQAFKEAEEKWEEPVPSHESKSGRGKQVTKSGVRNPQNILAELGEQGRRRIGPALSKHIYDIFMAASYD